MKRLLESSGARYLLASIAALAIDYALTLTLYHLSGLSLTASAAISFFAVGLAFYFVHEFWSFRADNSAFSFVRLGGNLAVLIAAGAVRAGVIGLLEGLQSPAGIWVSVYFAAGVACSFTTNFLLNRLLIFRR